MLLLILLQAQLIAIHHSEPIGPSISTGQTIHVCNGAMITFEYENDWAHGNRGLVKRVVVSGRERPDVATYLTDVAHNRGIQTVVAVRCPAGPKRQITGEIILSQAGSIRENLPQVQMFEFDDDGVIKR